MSNKEIQAAINKKQVEYDEIKRKSTSLNAADNPYSSGNERAAKANRLGHFRDVMKGLKSEIAELRRKLD